VFVPEETQDYTGGFREFRNTDTDIDKNFETLQSFFKLKPQIAH